MSRTSLVPLMVATFLCSVLPARAQSQLPEGSGKQLVESACARCHGVDLVARARFAREDWQDTLNLMVDFGAALTKTDMPVVVEYLAKNFPGEPKPPAVVVPGSVQVSIKEWMVPTPGSRPHDPLAAQDGSLWYTGQMANVLGRLDPKTGEFKEYPLKAPSGPHGLVADKEGNIWFTAQAGGYVGKLDPKTGETTEYRMPDPAARDPHTPIFDQKGTLWFTLQGSNMVGRIIPKTGEVKVVSVPTPRSNPYGMVVNSKGIPFFAEFGSNKLASLDPETMEIREHVLPNPGTRPRRIAITPDDAIWYGDYARGYLGRFDPKTGTAREWPSPSGPKSQPYGITAIGDVIWYSESAVRPNTLVRFDSKTEKFQTWVIPSGGGVVRNMMATRDGNLVLACSGVNRVALVEVKRGASTIP